MFHVVGFRSDRLYAGVSCPITLYQGHALLHASSRWHLADRIPTRHPIDNFYRVTAHACARRARTQLTSRYSGNPCFPVQLVSTIGLSSQERVHLRWQFHARVHVHRHRCRPRTRREGSQLWLHCLVRDDCGQGVFKCKGFVELVRCWTEVIRLHTSAAASSDVVVEVAAPLMLPITISSSQEHTEDCRVRTVSCAPSAVPTTHTLAEHLLVRDASDRLPSTRWTRVNLGSEGCRPGSGRMVRDTTRRVLTTMRSNERWNTFYVYRGRR